MSNQCEEFEALLQSLKDSVYERGEGLPIPAIIGVIEMLKLEILKESENDSNKPT